MHLLKLIGLPCVLVKLKGMGINIELSPKTISISDPFAQAYREYLVAHDLINYTWINLLSIIKSDITS